MEDNKYYFAVDLGATSGRTIVGHIADGHFELEEVTRFPNNLIVQGGHYYWDIHALYFEVIRGLKEVAKRGLNIASIGIDTWGVDFVMIGADGAILRNPRSYRDPVTFEMMNHYLQHVMSRREVYNITGIQLMNFNTLFQLYAMRQEKNTALLHAEKILFLSDALSWMLTGEEVCEYTIASTSQMLDPRTKELDEQLLASVGLSRDKFGRMVQPGEVIGRLTHEVQKLTGLGAIPVVAVAGHDTASAVAAVPACNEQFAYLSSGTWSLMGIETKEAIISDQSFAKNFTNEGGISGTTRFLKNICGMWLYERCRLEWPEEVRQLSHPELQGQAIMVEPFRSIINPDDPCFAAPTSMIDAIQQYCRNSGQPVPETPAELCRCIFDSLALRYKQVFHWLKDFAPFPIDVLHVIGGGSLNKYLTQFTANATGTVVLAGPQEGTAIGNIMLQAEADHAVKDIWQMRKMIADSLHLVRYEPTEQDAWDKAYQKYLSITNQKYQTMSKPLVETKARVGVFSIALQAYLPQFPQLMPEFEAQYEAFKKTLPNSIEIIDGGMVTTKEQSMAAGDKFRAADVDLVILQMLTYCTSYNMLPAVRDLDVPVVIVNLQKKLAPDYAKTDIPTWLGELYACGAIGEMVADLNRAGKRSAVITGVVEGGDPACQAEIEDWCRAAQVRRRFRDTNIAQIGRPYPGMMDLYIDETNLYHRMFVYTKQFDWEQMWAIADKITDEAAIRAKAEDILATFDIEGGGTIEKVWDMAKYVVAFEQWVKDEKLGMIASHYAGFAQGVAGKLDSMLIPAFSMLIKQHTACAVEGDMKVAMAMSILKTISGTGTLAEMYSIDFPKDICIIGHSGSGDFDISQAKKPTMKIVPVFHGKTGGGYLTQFYPPTGPVTYLGITQDKNGVFKFVVAEGVNEDGEIFTFGDTNMRTKFSLPCREFVNKWSEAGPTHHMAAAVGHHIDTILKVAKILNVEVDVVCR